MVGDVWCKGFVRFLRKFITTPSFQRSGVSRQAAKRLLAKLEPLVNRPEGPEIRCYASVYALNSGLRRNDGSAFLSKNKYTVTRPGACNFAWTVKCRGAIIVLRECLAFHSLCCHTVYPSLRYLFGGGA